jgi:hypothetical protein
VIFNELSKKKNIIKKGGEFKMNMTIFTRVVGGIVLFLGLMGLMSGETQMFAMNMDLALDLTRIALGFMLLVSTFMSRRAERTVWAIFGIVYLANFVIALISPTMFGMLPHGYGDFDNTLHFVGGVTGLIVAFWPATSMHHTRHAV